MTVLIMTLISMNVHSQIGEYKTIDEVYPEEKSDMNTVSEWATGKNTEYHKYKKRGTQMMVAGVITTAIGGIMYYYADVFMQNPREEYNMKVSSVLVGSVGVGVMISASFPLTKARKIKINGQTY